MPVIELDMLIALLNASDKLHQTASSLFEKIVSGEIRGVKVASSAYLEYELILRSGSYPGSEIRKDLTAFKNLPNLGEAPLTVNVILKASQLREEYGLSYFDSLHAATAILTDKEMISQDRAYGKIKGIRAITPQDLV